VADQTLALKIMLAEYERLKEEQRVRIGVRDNLIYATLASLAGVAVVALTGPGHPDLLLLAAPVCVVLGWTYLVNDQKVSAIGHYLRTQLAPALATLTTPDTPVLAWETAHRTDARRTSRKRLQLAVDLLTFCLPGLAALTLHWHYGHHTPALLVIALAELLTILILATQITRYADLHH
jgi:hypothetical protein